MCGGELDAEPAVDAAAGVGCAKGRAGALAVAEADVFDEDGRELGAGRGGGEGGEDCVILYHWTAGWPTMTLPKARVLLPERRAVPVPVSETKAGLALAPAVTERRP